MIIANYMVEHSDLNEIWMVVSPHNPHKEKKSLAKDRDRLHLVNLAIGDNLKIKASDFSSYEAYIPVIQKLANVTSVEATDAKVENAATFMIEKDEFYVPLGEYADTEEDKEEAQKEIDRLEGFIKGIDKKLSNEKFVNNAPEKVVAMEKKKKADAEAKIALLKQKL